MFLFRDERIFHFYFFAIDCDMNYFIYYFAVADRVYAYSLPSDIELLDFNCLTYLTTHPDNATAHLHVRTVQISKNDDLLLYYSKPSRSHRGIGL